MASAGEKSLRGRLGAGVASLAPRDAEFLFNESDGHLSHLVAVYVFDATDHPAAEMSHAQATRWVGERAGHARFFTHRVRRVPLVLDYPYWEPVDDGGMGDHVTVREIREPGWDPVQKVLGEILTRRMDLSRPPWELHVLNGVEGLDDLPGRLTIVALKTHHCAGDGLAVRALMGKLFSEETCPAAPSRTPGLLGLRMFARALLGVPGQISRFRRGLAASGDATGEITRAEAAGELPTTRPEHAPTRFNRAMRGPASVHLITLSGAQVRSVKDQSPRATVNDVLLAVVAGALRRYLAERGEEPSTSLAAMVPRSMRKVAEWESANQLAILSVDLHTDIADPLERLGRISGSARGAKDRSSHPAVRRLSGRLETSPALLLRITGLTQRLFPYASDRLRLQNTTVSNIPLEVDGLVLGGAPGVAVLAAQPPTDGDGLRHFLVAARRDELTLNVISNVAAMPDPERYRDLLRESFSELRAAAGRQAAVSGTEVLDS